MKSSDEKTNPGNDPISPELAAILRLEEIVSAMKITLENVMSLVGDQDWRESRRDFRLKTLEKRVDDLENYPDAE